MFTLCCSRVAALSNRKVDSAYLKKNFLIIIDGHQEEKVRNKFANCLSLDTPKLRRENSPCTWGQHWVWNWTRWPWTVFPNLDVPYSSGLIFCEEIRIQGQISVQMNVFLGPMLHTHLTLDCRPRAPSQSTSPSTVPFLHLFHGFLCISLGTCEGYFLHSSSTRDEHELNLN